LDKTFYIFSHFSLFMTPAKGAQYISKCSEMKFYSQKYE